MERLRTLTLIYVVVLVVAVAVSLVAILFYLQRIAAILGEVRGTLRTVSDETRPLDEHLQRLRDASAQAAEEMAKAEAKLSAK